VIVAILGKGNVGSALAGRLVASGHEVRVGVRPGADAAALRNALGERAKVTGVREAVAGAEVVFVATATAAAPDVVREAGGLAGQIVVDCTNPVGRDERGLKLAPPPEGSVAQAIAAAAPRARLVKAFNVFGAEFHADPRLAGTQVDVPMASDDT
jgi:predicted dinucleotide-binding enzyme